VPPLFTTMSLIVTWLVYGMTRWVTRRLAENSKQQLPSDPIACVVVMVGETLQSDGGVLLSNGAVLPECSSFACHCHCAVRDEIDVGLLRA